MLTKNCNIIMSHDNTEDLLNRLSKAESMIQFWHDKNNPVNVNNWIKTGEALAETLQAISDNFRIMKSKQDSMSEAAYNLQSIIAGIQIKIICFESVKRHYMNQ